MNVAGAMTTQVRTCRADDSLASVAKLLWDADCGCAPVVGEGNHLAGMITDRDICMAACLSGCSLGSLVVSGAMSKTVHSCRPDDPLGAAERLMQANRVRRLPVVDAEEHVVGIVSLNDNLYDVRIDLAVKGGELVVRRDAAQHQAHEDLSVAIRDAFEAARRRLQDHARRQRADVKTSVEPERARVVRILPEEGYGFLETPDRREIYFHRNSVLGDAFDRLAIGTVVRFAEEQGEKGPQATSVTVQD